MTDRELLEAAARAAGIDRFSFDGHDDYIVDPSYIDADGFPVVWDPLTDDGDALRLAVALKIDVCWNTNEGPWEVNAWLRKGMGSNEDPSRDPYAATRRAIVRTAAEIGRNLKK